MKTQLHNLTATAANYYEASLPFHNFSHATSAINYGKQIARLANSPVNQDVIYYALLFHDAGFKESHEAQGYKTKEAYSAAIAERELAAAGVEAETVAQVVQAILATHINAECHSIEDQIVRLADIGNVGGDYKTFMIENRKAKAEHEQMTGRTIDWIQWRQHTASVLSHFLNPVTELNEAFVARANKNLARFLQK